MHFSTYRLNTYFGMLILTIVASGATILIVRVANATNFAFIDGNEAQYASFKESILHK